MIYEAYKQEALKVLDPATGKPTYVVLHQVRHNGQELLLVSTKDVEKYGIFGLSYNSLYKRQADGKIMFRQANGEPATAGKGKSYVCIRRLAAAVGGGGSYRYTKPVEVPA